MNFRNKTVIITGAAIGIGKATALEFARLGANVCIIDINKENLNSVENEILKLGTNVSSYTVDVSNEIAVRETVENIISKYSKVDILINNAGIWRIYDKTFIETESNSWKKFFDVNVFGTFYFTHAVLPNMLKNKYGRIINIGSVAGTYGNAKMAVYSATKGAIRSFTKALAKEVAEDGITVNNIVLGNVKNEDSPGNPNLSYMARSGELQEYADLITFIASDKAAYISGQDYVIDGCRKKL